MISTENSDAQPQTQVFKELKFISNKLLSTKLLFLIRMSSTIVPKHPCHTKTSKALYLTDDTLVQFGGFFWLVWACIGAWFGF